MVSRAATVASADSRQERLLDSVRFDALNRLGNRRTVVRWLLPTCSRFTTPCSASMGSPRSCNWRPPLADVPRRS
jgi:hypothetical protein